MIRRWSVGFALFSAIYWFAATGISLAVDDVSAMASHKPPSLWMVWLLQCVPAILYAVICVLFCHVFARRLIRQVQQSASKD
jgi:hypothetical protein